MPHIEPDLPSAAALVVGDVMLDRYWSGSTRRISPEAPVPVVNVDGVEDRPGGAANVALNIVTLGGRAALVGLVGDDEAGDELDRHLSAADVDVALARVPGYRTTTKLRVRSLNQQLVRLDFEEVLGAADAKQILPSFEAALARSPDVVVLSDYAKGALRDAPALIARARDSGVPVIVDPKGVDFGRYSGADIVTPNLHEFEGVVGPVDSYSELVDEAFDLLRRLSLRALLVTRGPQGMALVQADGNRHDFPAEARAVYDVTGAGDTVVAALALGVGAGWSLPEAARFANTCAAIAVGKAGTSPVTVRDLRSAFSDHRLSGVVDDAAAIQQVVSNVRQEGKTVVFTNGCFDILHAGHVRYLAAARALGDVLVVGVNSDSSVTALKGAGRPINNLASRCEVLAGLTSVDWVVPFEDPTPIELVKAVLPDVLVKGGDYSESDVVGGAEVVARGGRVVVVDFHPGYSTTNIANSLGAAP